MNSVSINGINTYCFSSRQEVIDLAFSEKKSLIALNAEKILHADDNTRDLLNRNITFTDGAGAVWALKRKGFKEAVKIPGCELWLDIVKRYSIEKSFYLVGATRKLLSRPSEN